MRTRIPLIAAAAALAGAGGWTAYRRIRARFQRNHWIINDTLPVHSKWWREQAKLPGEFLYVAVGDSAAQGIGASLPGHSYVGVIADHVRELTDATVRVVNLSVAGARVSDAVDVQLPRLAKMNPDLVTVSIGANDVGSLEPEHFRAQLRTIFDALPEGAIVADLPYFFLPWSERTVAVGNGILRSLAAERGLTVAPLHERMRGEGIRGILTQFAIDFFHPNDNGYRVWASAFLPAVTARVLAERPEARKPSS